jgi:NitT/TauT family transport system ATP-binding protein
MNPLEQHAGDQNILTCRDVYVRFDTGRGDPFTAVGGVSISVKTGELICLVGPSGCGKSTLLHVFAGLTPATSGSVFVEGKSVRGPSSSVAYMTQRDTLLPWATTLDNVLLPIRAVHRKDVDFALELIHLVGLTGYERHRPHQLSGGMRKRVQLARALAQRPRLLLMDEPFGALDSQTKILIQREFLQIWERDRISVVFVTHDLAEAIGVADRVFLMSKRPGRVTEVHNIDLPRPRKADGVLTEEAYQSLYRLIWQGLESELVVR